MHGPHCFVHPRLKKWALIPSIPHNYYLNNPINNMKFSIVFVSSFAGLAVAQTLTSSAQPPISSADIPKCVFECGLKASQAIGCTTDVYVTVPR
ncbi:hypothetical protein FS749_011848 [Ceratobasidium sp. UAMH 11750]|nr:hypothetical protein FS749_011848 [Ceratobasidium sp. UAMH 11750]